MKTTGRPHRGGTHLAGHITARVCVVLAVAAGASVAWVGEAPTSSAAAGSGAYVAVGPMRLADTRLATCGCTRVDASTITVGIVGRADVPGIPDGAVAAAVVITATPTPSPGYVTAFPTGLPQPLASTLNTRPDRVVANSTIVQIGSGGAISLFQSQSSDLVVDITGVFVGAANSRSGRYLPVVSRRLVDTREAGPSQGPIMGDLTLPLPTEVPADATALAVTVTSVGDEAPGFVSSRPAGQPAVTSSFLNVNGSGQAVAATAILPVSAGGLTLQTSHRGHLVVDLLGWFTGPSAPSSDIGLFVPIGPQRLLDTRSNQPRAWPGGTVELAVDIPGAASIVSNVTATYSDRAGFVTAYPAGTVRPNVSTLNPAMFDHTLANLAITQLSTRGLAYYARSGADIVVDVTGMFTGSPVTATEPPPPNQPGRSRVLAVGDSTLLAIPLYSGSLSALIGFDGIVDAASCRRLLRPSCLSSRTGEIPNTAVEAILGTPGTIDILIVKTGYNDWFSDFPREFDAVVQAGRAKGAHTIVWMSYTDEGVSRPRARQAYVENNLDLFALAALPQYSDVVIADWRTYVRTAPPSWTYDGTHLTEYGAWLASDYIARFVAAIEHRPCPTPWGPGGTAFNPCPKPELIGAVPGVRDLY